MNVNLPWGYTADMSQPRSTEMAFYAPEQPDFLFTRGESVAITCQPMYRALGLSWELCHSGLTTPLRRGKSMPGFDNSLTIAIDTASLTPGFYDLRVCVQLSHGKCLTGITAFGWRTLEEPLRIVEPDDFLLYWQGTASAIRHQCLDLRVEPEFTLRDEEIDAYNITQACLPEQYDPEGELFSEIEVYRVDFAAPGGGRIYGRFARPAGGGDFPGLLVLPGAGNRPRPAPVEHARHGYAALDIQVHGLPTDLADYPPLPESEGYDSLETFPHYEVYRNALRAVDALLALPGVDTGRIAVVGGSQGGRLAVVVAALDERVRAAVPALAHFAYLPFVHWQKRMNASGDAGGKGFSTAVMSNDAHSQVEAFFDTVHFAPLITCPTLLSVGLIDPVSPPSTVFALYRRIGGPKEIRVMPNHGHDWTAAFERYAWHWLSSALNATEAQVLFKQ